jgi:hypothetical protein
MRNNMNNMRRVDNNLNKRRNSFKIYMVKKILKLKKRYILLKIRLINLLIRICSMNKNFNRLDSNRKILILMNMN